MERVQGALHARAYIFAALQRCDAALDDAARPRRRVRGAALEQSTGALEARRVGRARIKRHEARDERRRHGFRRREGHVLGRERGADPLEILDARVEVAS